MVKDRIKEFRRVRGCDIRPCPDNWRTHPQAQREAMAGILAEVGIADVLLCRETPEGLELIDGHLRADVAPEAEWPVAILDVSEAEARKLLATLDPLAAMADADAGKLDALLRDVETGSEALASMLSDLAAENGIIPADDKPTELKPLSTQPPPVMSWVLLGIPTVRFGEIAADVERLAAVATVCETTVNSGDKDRQP